MSELVQAAAALHASDLETARAQVVLLHDAKLRCDSALITSLLQNLFANAIKNRKGNEHNETNGNPLGVQINALAFASQPLMKLTT